VHPRNPYAPTFHANVRYFESDEVAWFGGGADLTPYYLFEDDARHFHRVLADVCDRHDVADHAGWKRACDEYFHLPHRGEARGVGGLFFDHLTESLDAVWSFQRDLADHLLDAYLPILERRAGTPYGNRETEWHRIRRGRYVEFNLVWDRGTRFGLETGGRTESILGSLPPVAAWSYDHEPDPDSPEGELLAFVRGEPRDWI
ncbi:MAG: coproporphyrinogen III oxidase, partial [Acidimicrobiia bacterium]|nr:coproporphyrinogen III oxidase [Acidimicrobiia bacterium]